MMTMKKCQCLLKHPVQNKLRLHVYLYLIFRNNGNPVFLGHPVQKLRSLNSWESSIALTHVIRHPVQKTNLMAIFLLSPKKEKLTETPCFWDTLYRKNSSILKFHWDISSGKCNKTYIFSETLHRKQNLISMFI